MVGALLGRTCRAPAAHVRPKINRNPPALQQDVGRRRLPASHLLPLKPHTARLAFHRALCSGSDSVHSPDVASVASSVASSARRLPIPLPRGSVRIVTWTITTHSVHKSVAARKMAAASALRASSALTPTPRTATHDSWNGIIRYESQQPIH